MTINAKIKDAELNFLKWRGIIASGARAQHDKTEAQALMLRERFEGRLEAFVKVKQLMRAGV